MKILLGIAGVFVLLIGAAVWKGYSWWQAHGKEYVAAIDAAQHDGKTLGRSADNAACVKGAIDRFGSDTTAIGLVSGVLFTQSCLPESKLTAGFCDGVPTPRDRTAAREWARKKCDDLAVASSRNCMAIVAAVPGFCHLSNKDTSTFHS